MATSTAVGVTIRVDATSQNPNGPGFPTWIEAFNSLDAALAYAKVQANNVDVIWVAAIPGLPPDINGSTQWAYGPFNAYRPTVLAQHGDPRSATFRIHGPEASGNLDGVKIYGGFKGLAAQAPEQPETQLNQRNVLVNHTILAAQTNYGIEGMKYHVVTFDDVGATTRLDGFWIVHGRADTIAVTDGNVGGAILIRNANPLIARCLLTHNYATEDGSGIYLKSTQPNGTLHLVNCTFIDQTDPGEGRDGGAVYNNGQDVEIMNCQFFGNKCNGNGAGVYNNGGNLSVVNSTFWSNKCNSSADCKTPGFLADLRIGSTACACVSREYAAVVDLSCIRLKSYE